jgi:hypothetical protein
MNMKLTIADYNYMLKEIEKDKKIILLKIGATNRCLAGGEGYLEQVEACQIAGGYYKKELLALIQAGLQLAVERAILIKEG